MTFGRAHAQPGVRLEREQLQLRVVGDASLEGAWQILQATFDEDFRTTRATLVVRNRAAREVLRTRLYGEYFDAAGRLCLTAVFTQEEEDGAFGVGEVRTLMTNVGQVAPATAPVEVRVRSLGPTPGPGDEVVKSPITVTSWSPPGMERLPDSLAPTDSKDPLVSLVLAEVNVSSEGKALRIRMIAARSPDTADWFRGFIENLSYNTVRPGFAEPQSGVCLLLIGLQRNVEGGTVAAYAARSDPWIRRYVGGLDSEVIPAVNELRFVPETWLGTALANGSAPGWRYLSVGTDWCPQSFHWVYPSNGTMRLEWFQGPNRPKFTVGPAGH